MDNIEIVVIINSYNRLSLLKDSIDSLCSEMGKSNIGFAIVIFEAGSTDGSIEWINKFIENSNHKIFLLIANSDSDNSFSHGVNFACKFAIEKFNSFKYFLLYETDNYLRSCKPIIDSKILLDGNPDIVACGYTVKKYNGSNAGFGISFPSIISFILGQQLSFLLKFNYPSPQWEVLNENQFCYSDVVYTSPLLIKQESWIEVDGFDEYNFPFSDCDVDLAYRLFQNGYKMAVINSEYVIHDNRQVSSSWSSTRTINFYKARYRYFRKHFGLKIIFFKPFLLLQHIFELCLLSVLFVFNKAHKGSLWTRWKLIKGVFTNYRF